MSVFNSLYRKSFELSSKFEWDIFATEIFKEVDLNKNNFEDFNNAFFLVKDTFKNTLKKNIPVKEKYEENILEKITNLDDSSKLACYFLILFIKTFLRLLFIWHCRKKNNLII
jgi:hypothetical protein